MNRFSFYVALRATACDEDFAANGRFLWRRAFSDVCRPQLLEHLSMTRQTCVEFVSAFMSESGLASLALASLQFSMSF